MDKDRRANFLRKLHSFAGVFPLGIFLCFHMCVNYSANWGTAPYDTMGSFMAHMPYKIVLETFVIFLPLLFHALYGVYIALTSSVTVQRYRYFRNWCYVLQRIAGIVTLLFVMWHIYGTKLQVELTGVDPSYSMVAGIVATPLGLALFAIGLLCSIYHFCNGLWTFLITWGITVSPRSQKISGYVLFALFIAFAAFGLKALFAFAYKLRQERGYYEQRIEIADCRWRPCGADGNFENRRSRLERRLVFRRSNARRSACAQGGINAALNTKGEDDSVDEHFDDTIYGGDFLANQPQVRAMCEAAPKIVNMFDRMGVMFNRTPEGLLDLRRFGGTQKRRTAFAGTTTGQQLLYALDEQVRALEVEGKVHTYVGWEFVSVIIHNGTCCGITAQDLTSMEIRAFPADAVVIATGGCGAIFGKSTNSTINTGYAAARCYQQGALYANGEFIQIHPTAIPGFDKNRLMSESARGEGGRVWTYKDGKPWYFLEEKYPAYGNLVPRDIATREIFDVYVNQHLGINESKRGVSGRLPYSRIRFERKAGRHFGYLPEICGR